MIARAGDTATSPGDRTDPPLLLAAPDKFRGTATGTEVAEAASKAARTMGWSALAHPLADGGEGMLEAVGGHVRVEHVPGPLGELVEAEWRLVETPDGGGPTAVIEMARAAGRALVEPGTQGAAVRASTSGVGALIAAALSAGARRVVVGCGGSATTDGGEGAIAVLGGPAALRGAELVVATDVSTPFLDAARVFGPQKGASPADVELLERRLESLATRYAEQFGVDVTVLLGAGAAGGLAGGLAAIGGTIVSGFELVAELTGLDGALARADLVLTGEGRLDVTSLSGKVVSGVIAHAAGKVAVLVVAGSVDGVGPAELAAATGAAPSSIEVVDLVERFGAPRAFDQVAACVDEVVHQHLAQVGRWPRTRVARRYSDVEAQM
jgi:glycerate kinase